MPRCFGVVISSLVASTSMFPAIFVKSRNRGGGGGTVLKGKKVGVPNGGARVLVHYDTHLSALSLWDGENLRSLLVRKVVPTLHGHVLCKNWHL